jgi:hypothetical protein
MNTSFDRPACVAFDRDLMLTGSVWVIRAEDSWSREP